MGLFVVVYPKFRCCMFWRYITPTIWVDTIVVYVLPIRFWSVVTTGQPFTNIFTSSPNNVIVPTGWSNFEKARALFKSYSGAGAIWCMGQWFYGPVCEFSWDEVYNSGGCLRVKMGISYNTSSQWRKEGHHGLEKEYFFQDLAHLEPLLVMVALTFVTSWSNGYLRNMEFVTMWLLLIIQILVGKFRCPIEEWSKFLRKLWMLIELDPSWVCSNSLRQPSTPL